MRVALVTGLVLVACPSCYASHGSDDPSVCSAVGTRHIDQVVVDPPPGCELPGLSDEFFLPMPPTAAFFPEASGEIVASGPCRWEANLLQIAGDSRFTFEGTIDARDGSVHATFEATYSRDGVVLCDVTVTWTELP